MTCTLNLTPDQLCALAPLRCLAAEASQDAAPGLVLGQVWFQAGGTGLAVFGFVGHEAGLELIETLGAGHV